MKKLSSQPEVEFRAALLWEAGVGLLLVLVRIGPAADGVYETWLNEHAPGQSGTLATLAEQSRLVVRLYGNKSELERILVVSNRLDNFARQALAEIIARPAWTMQEFDQAREQLLSAARGAVGPLAERRPEDGVTWTGNRWSIWSICKSATGGPSASTDGQRP